MSKDVMLLPCPFCGSTEDAPLEEVVHVSMSEHDWRNPSWTVQCDNCTATMGYSDTEEEAIDAWNTRTPDHAARADRAEAALLEAREALEQLADCIEPVLPPPEYETILVPIAPTSLGHTQAQTTSTNVTLSVRGKDLGNARKSLTAARATLAALEPKP